MRSFAPLLLVVLAGCIGAVNGRGSATPTVRMYAEKDLDCPGDDIRVTEEYGGVYKAVGCGRKAHYRTLCEGLSCHVQGEGDGPVGWKDRPDPGTPLAPR